ncbi:hypothetical protein FSP39_020448 [Pinctada imbricata]|uniref:Uncharacterized protein n=1 Tax=Pinctada imbricata TaxID=66713 RepID=A0AA89BTE9_PINIB|nr:hypothetical protein FSP39_020448 [Pinctada imbricata]
MPGGGQVDEGTQHVEEPNASLEEDKGLEVVPEESDEDDLQLDIPEQQIDDDDRPPSLRVPSQKSRPVLARTPASKQPESPLLFPEDIKEEEDEQILITEIDQGEYKEVEYPVDDSDIELSDSEDVPHVTIETVDAEPTEEDYDTDLEVEETETFHHHDTSGKSHYRKFCNQLGIVPVSYFLRHIEDTEIAMRYHGLGPSSAKAIALVLKLGIVPVSYFLRHIEDTEIAMRYHGLGPSSAKAIALVLKLGKVPVSYFLRHIEDTERYHGLGPSSAKAIALVLKVGHVEDTEIAMRYHGLGPSSAKAIALVLKDNISLEKLDIRGNWIESEGGESVARMLEENDYITDICLADNKLGLEGIQSICRMLKVNAGLRRIDLSDNGFEVPEAVELAQAIENNKYLKVLNLSHNRFGEKAGEILGPAIGANDILDVLDLSWNHLRQNGAIAVAKGIKENVRLKKCNLAWNGFGPEGGAAIADALVTNNSIQDIDISGNRLNSDTAIRIAKAISTNDNIKILRIGNNLLTTMGALALVKALNETDSSEMEELDLTDVPVEFEFLRVCEDIKAKRPNIKILHGPVLRAGNTADDLGKPGVDLNPKKKDPVVVLKEHIVVNDYRLLDILKRYDPEGSMTLEPDHFLAAIDELAVPFDRAKIEEAVNRLVDQKPGEEQGRIYFGARRLSDKLLSQGFVCDRLTSSLRKFYGRHGELVIHYDVPLSRMVDDILS